MRTRVPAKEESRLDLRQKAKELRAVDTDAGGLRVERVGGVESDAGGGGHA